MKNALVKLIDKFMMKKRNLIESVNNALIENCKLENTRHRSPMNAIVHATAALLAHNFMDNKPSISIPKEFGLVA